jgi:hypothetical protein
MILSKINPVHTTIYFSNIRFNIVLPSMPWSSYFSFSCDVEAPTFSLDIWLADGSKAVSLIRRPPLAPRKIPGAHFCLGLSRPQGLVQLKNSMTSSGIELATFRLVS